ncbi:type III PLP-dependent enzyme [Nocardia sp. NPDC050175]|uniref:type III PLP-dependent enzyme n=1 Tax=Nocardia sp. NPDC050175 TaxID=3364317 RepID=UPI0037AC306E
MTDYAELAKRFGTPLYIYDADRIRRARRDLFDGLPEAVELYYALKANPHPDVVRVMREGTGRACRAEISSTGELAAALAAGFQGADILYTGPGKTGAELAEALAAGVRLFSVESSTDLEHVGAEAEQLGVVADCLIRVNSATANSSTGIRMTGVPSQFGFDSENLADLRDQLLGVRGTSIAGAHFFPLSNARDESSLIAEFTATITLAARLQDELGVRFRFLDIGGGFAAPYGVIGDRPVYSALREALSAVLEERFPGWRDGAPRIACESGRYLVADSGQLICSVVNLKDSRGSRYLIADAGINTFGGLSGLGRLLPVAVSPQVDGQAADQVASLVGPLCTPGDILGRNIAVPSMNPGDLVVIPNAGAYGLTASLSMFLGRPVATEVLVSDGQVVSASRLRHVRDYQIGAQSS